MKKHRPNTSKLVLRSLTLLRLTSARGGIPRDWTEWDDLDDGDIPTRGRETTTGTRTLRTTGSANIC